MRKKAFIILTAVLALILIVMEVGCPASADKVVTVGNKNFTEQYIVGQMIKQLLEDRGFTVELKSGRSSACLREGMEFGDIDICAEYTGTAWMVHLASGYKSGMGNNEVYNEVKKEEMDNGFTWLKPIWNNNTYALASWPEFVEEYGLQTLSDLAALYREKEGEIKTSVGLEFSTRPDGMPALENYYNFEVAQACRLIEPVSIPMESLKNHESDVAMVFGTDACIAEYGWHVYLDDKSFFPPYDLAPYVYKKVLDEYPEIADILSELVATFPGGGGTATPEIVAQCQKVWQELNAKVDIYEVEPSEVAREYLVEHDLIEG